MKTPVHIIAGFLGTGKTTVLRTELAARAGKERCAVIVNDFGEARIDRELLGGAVKVSDIAGGCVCCTAPADLVPSLTAILEEIQPDRLFIEPSGLARPQDIVDMLARSGLRDRVELRPTLVLVDPQRLLEAPNALVAEQLDAADVVVASRCDLASPEALANFDTVLGNHWPPPLLIVRSEHGILPPAVWEWPAQSGLRLSQPRHQDRPSTEGYLGRSFEFPAGQSFHWDALRNLLGKTPNLERFKGLFRSDVGPIRVDWAGGRLSFEATAHRRDSRADAIFREPADLDAFGRALEACGEVQSAATGPEIALVDADGRSLSLGRRALRGLPGQVADVSILVPGRQGSGIYLREVLALAPGGERYMIGAGDGMTTRPAPVEGVGEALLVHSLGDEELPESQGGPYRILVPPGEERSNCGNVKGVVRIRLLPGS